MPSAQIPALAPFSAPTREWFAAALGEPTPVQEQTWASVGAGAHTLAIAPTGSGKTLAAFLWSLDQLLAGAAQDGTTVVYVSPLKALAADIERNLRAPLVGINRTAQLLGIDTPPVTVGVRTGDTSAADRRQMARTPPDILITTPESLYLLLTSAARATLTAVKTVIVDEIHAVAGTKRGAHLAVSLERLDAALPVPAQRIGLSATVAPAPTVAGFLGGSQPVRIVQPPTGRQVELSVRAPVQDMAAPPQLDDERGPSIWPHLEEQVVDLVAAARSSLVFANSRRLAERLSARLNEIAEERGLLPAPLARPHHGSMSRSERKQVEEELKAGRLPAVVATSSLELGIDMGAVDLVIQVEPPPSVASGLQRVGRAGHQVGATSTGVLFPKHRGDLLPTAVTVERMRDGAIEPLTPPQHPLDVLAQQVVAMVAMDDWAVDDLLALLRRAYPYRELPTSAYDAVVDMLSGRYPSDAFAQLRPRILWDRASGVLSARPGAQRLAVTSGGTIPDRGLFGVHLVDGGRVGELDEEMVYESRIGDVFTLGSTSWRIEEITRDRVMVSAAPGVPGRMPFWHGDKPARPAELGRQIGRFTREVGGADEATARARVLSAGLDDAAAANLLNYLAEQRQATGHLPDDRTVVLEQFRDELGDWRVVVHTPLGAAVTAPWALLVGARIRQRYATEPQIAHSDDGFVLRLPDADTELDLTDLLLFDPEEVADAVTAEIGTSALFGARFREAAGRSLLLPRRDPRTRQPLWQQRQRAAQLLSVASEFPTFPIVLEAVRECLQDVYDVPELIDLMRRLADRRMNLVLARTAQASPFARSLLYGYVAAFLYEGDAPLAERRAQALSLDATLLAELLGRAELRELLDPAVLADTEAQLQRLTADRMARDVEEAADLLRLLGPLTETAAAARGVQPEWLEELLRARRAIRVRVAEQDCVAAVEDAARLRDGLGVALPTGLPEAFTEPVADPLGDLVSRYARTHGPFTAIEAAATLGLGSAVVEPALAALARSGRLVSGEFRPGASGLEWCDSGVLRLVRQRSLAALRREAEPVEQAELGRFLPAWQGVGGMVRGAEGVLRVVEQLEGAALPVSALETLILPSRVVDYSPAALDELTSAGEVRWCGRGALPGGDGWVSLHLAESAPLTLPVIGDAPDGARHRAILDALGARDAQFFADLLEVLADDDPQSVDHALWDLVWAGLVTNDSLAPLRSAIAGPKSRGSARTAAAPNRYRRGRAGAPRVLQRHLTGRWSLLPARDLDPTRRGLLTAELLLDRHGVLTRGAVAAESVPGGFAAMYRVLSALEESGRCRRIYAVAGLGAAQFAAPGAVDRLRAGADRSSKTVVLAAADPANPFGAGLPWPAAPAEQGHRPGRKAGALVVVVDGEAVLYVERGGRSLISFTKSETALGLAADALALAVREGALGALTVERADGTGTLAGGVVAQALQRAGFTPTPRGLRLRS